MFGGRSFVPAVGIGGAGSAGAVLVQRNGKTIFEAACGVANAEWAIPNTVDTRFRTTSIAKNFTASAILLLQQEGKLSVTQPVSAFVPDLPETWHSATIHQLLTHTSGIPSYTAAPIRRLDRMGATPRELLDVVKDKPLQFPHGVGMAYNNSGYILLGMVIEKASGMSYPDCVEQRILARAQIKDSASTCPVPFSCGGPAAITWLLPESSKTLRR